MRLRECVLRFFCVRLNDAEKKTKKNQVESAWYAMLHLCLLSVILFICTKRIFNTAFSFKREKNTHTHTTNILFVHYSTTATTNRQ